MSDGMSYGIFIMQGMLDDDGFRHQGINGFTR